MNQKHEVKNGYEAVLFIQDMQCTFLKLYNCFRRIMQLFRVKMGQYMMNGRGKNVNGTNQVKTYDFVTRRSR